MTIVVIARAVEATFDGGRADFPAVHESGFGLDEHPDHAGECPLSAEADVRADIRVPVAIDPTATLAVHCGDGFDAGFSPYQSTLLSRYSASTERWGRACSGASSLRS